MKENKVGRPPSLIEKKNKSIKATDEQWEEIRRICARIKLVTKFDQSQTILNALKIYEQKLNNILKP